MGGIKIYKIVYDKYINFIDSLNFLPMPLSKFASTFGLENLEKGFYPHLFSTIENYNYIWCYSRYKIFWNRTYDSRKLY